MGVQRHIGRNRLVLLGMVLAWIAVAALAWGHAAQGPALAQEVEGGMALSAAGSDVSCDGGSCDVPAGGDFTLSVVTADAPSEGFTGFATMLSYGTDLTYNPTEAPEDEILWADNILPVRSDQPTWVTHGGLSSLTQPFVASDYEGTLVELSLTCSEDITTTNVVLVARSDANVGGTAYTATDDEGMASIVVPVNSSGTDDTEFAGSNTTGPYDLASALEINCGEEEAAAEEEEPEPTPPADLPGTGAGVEAAGGSTGIWMTIAILLLVSASLTAAGWRYARSRQVS